MKFKRLDGTGIDNLKYVEKNVTRHGGVRYYVRRNGVRLGRLRQTPGTIEFVNEHSDILAGRKPIAEPKTDRPQRRSVAHLSYDWVCREYFASGEFKGLSNGTRRKRRARLEAIGDRNTQNGKFGSWPITVIEPRHILKIRDEHAGSAEARTPEAANERVKALRQLFTWAMQPALQYVKDNPALKVPYLKSANPGGFHEWTEAEIAQYEARHAIGTYARLALDLFQYTGARTSDVYRMGPQMEHNSELHWTEHKGHAELEKKHELPIVPALRQSIDAMPPSMHLVYIVNSFGRPFTKKGFENWFKKRCVEAGLPHCSAHGVRKRASERVADGGGTVHGMMATFGWTTEKQAIHYTKKANRRRLEKATAPLLANRIENEIATPTAQTREGLAISGKKS